MARGVATLFSENGKKRSSSPLSHGLKSDDNDELYAGGEMSAMAIETPKSEIDMKVKRLLEMAELNPAPPPSSTTAKTAAAKRKPKGPPQRLDGSIPTPIPEEQEDDEDEDEDEEDLVTEIGVYFWKNGFTCSTHNHRKLFSNDDPQTAKLLEEMEKGFVPIEVFGESKRRHSGKISIVVERKLDEKWIPGSFDGVPQRLGDTPTFPAPSAVSSAPTMTTTPTPPTTTTTACTTITKELPNYDPSSTTTTKIQIKDRNAKIIIKCNPLTHTVKDLYDAIDDLSSNNSLLHSLRPPLVLEDRKDQRSLDELSLRNATLILK